MNLKDGVKLSIGAIIGVVVVVHGTKLALQIVNRPKRLPPGPRPWPLFGNALQLGPSPCRMLAKVCDQYGGVMSLWVGSRPTVIVTSPKVALSLFSSKITQGTFESRPGLIFRGGALSLGEAPAYWKHMGAQGNKTLEWRKLRRVLSIYLTNTSSKTKKQTRETNRDHVLAVMMENLRQEASSNKCFVVNARTHLRAGILNIVFTTCFGSVVDLSTGMMDYELVRLLTAFKEVVRLGVTSRFSDYLPVLREIPATIADIELAETTKQAEECCLHTVTAMRNKYFPTDSKSSVLPHSFFDVLCGLQGEDRLSDWEITLILTEILLTATESTSTLVEWALGQLICRPDMQAMIQAEIDRVVGTRKSISEKDVEKMPYLKAVIKETQRLNHPVLLTLPHVTTKPLDVSEGNYHLPAGTTVIAHISALLTDPDLWDDPHEFRPERHFLDFDEEPDDPEKTRMQREIFRGIRRFCPGQGLVLQKAQILLAKILQSFDVLPAFEGRPKPLDETSCAEFGVINQLKMPLDASLRSRSSTFGSQGVY